MKPNPGPGKLIVLEGLDGAGTTTQSAHLADWLRKYHAEKISRVLVTREPSTGPAGAQIRSVLTRRIKMDGHTLAALFTADRIDHLYEKRGIIERLKAGEWVIMYRYYLSSFAYQSLSLKQEGLRWLWYLHEPCLIPDVTFFLDVPVGTCMTRIGLNRGFHFELFEKEDALEAVRLKYLDAMQRFRGVGQNLQMIEGTESVLAVAKNIRQRVKMMFLDNTYLSAEEQETIWERWPVLKEVRRNIEDELGLSFVTIRKIPESKGARGGSQGGIQLELAGRVQRIYHVTGHYSDRGRSMKLRAQGPGDDILPGLRKVCPRIIHLSPHVQRTLWSGVEQNERSEKT